MRGLLLFIFVVSLDASLSLPTMYASGMVIQHSEPFMLWGSATSDVTKVTVSFSAKTYSSTVKSGRWEVTLPATNPSLTPSTIEITGGNDTISLIDILFGEVYVCSGQSNMGLPVISTLNGSQEIANSGNHGSGLRVLQVDTSLSYYNVTQPQTNLTASIPWGRPAPPGATPIAGAAPLRDIGGFSAFCFYTGVEMVKSNPDMPVGLIASAWGGTAIEVWMTPKALQQCGATSRVVREEESVWRNPDPGLLLTATAAGVMTTGLGSCPVVHSTLWNAMIAPLSVLSTAGFLWYQVVRFVVHFDVHLMPYLISETISALASIVLSIH